MPNGSWFKLYRGIRTSDLMRHPNALTVFIFLLTRARLSDGIVGGEKIKAGSAVSSWKDIAEHTGLTRQAIRTTIKYLIKAERITTKVTNKFTVFTIVNWAYYQSGSEYLTTKPTTKQPPSNHQATTKQPPSNHIDRNKESVESKNEKKQEHLVGADPDRFPEAMVKLYTENPPSAVTAVRCIRLSHPSFERVPEFQLVNALESHPERERWGEAIEALAQGFAGVPAILRPIPALNKYLAHEEQPKQKVWGE